MVVGIPAEGSDLVPTTFDNSDCDRLSGVDGGRIEGKAAVF